MSEIALPPCEVAAVEQLTARAGAEPVFLCGSPSNADELSGCLAWIICVFVDEPTLWRRLARAVTLDGRWRKWSTTSSASWWDVVSERADSRRGCRLGWPTTGDHRR